MRRRLDLAMTLVGDSAIQSVVWCTGIALAGYLRSKRLFNRDPSL
jgi:hypothetical protein